MKIIPVVNNMIIGRYRQAGSTVTDLFTNKIYKSANESTAKELLSKLNMIGMYNSRIIDSKGSKAQLLCVYA